MEGARRSFGALIEVRWCIRTPGRAGVGQRSASSLRRASVAAMCSFRTARAASRAELKGAGLALGLVSAVVRRRFSPCRTAAAAQAAGFVTGPLRPLRTLARLSLRLRATSS